MDVHDFVRAFLACHFTFVAVFYASKTAALTRRTGIWIADPGTPGTTQFVGHRVFHAFRIAIWALTVLRVPFPAIDQALVPLHGHGVALVEAAGVALMIASLAIVIYSHSYMEGSWRSGVPAGGNDALLTEGPFAITRNPIFIGVMLGQVGFLLALPTLFALVCLVIGVTVIVFQSRHEEAELSRRFGKAYDAYRTETPRWLAVGGRSEDNRQARA